MDNQDPVKSVAVVGGGVSGLAAAYKLKSNGVKVTVFEAEGRAGGKIRSNSVDGFIWDEGANTMTESETEVGNLIDELGLRKKQQYPISQTKRYIAKNGVPLLIPSNPFSLITSNFFSAQSKLKIILEPFVCSRKTNSSDASDAGLTESVGQFFERHFGREVVDYLIDPFVAGSSGSDPESLSMPHAFPELWSLEKNYGSVIVGAVRAKALQNPKDNAGKTATSSDNKKRQRGSFSFQGGMQVLTDMLCTKLGDDSMKLQSEVLSLAYDLDKTSLKKCWSVSYATKGENHSKLQQPFDAIIMTAPLCNIEEMKITKKGAPFIIDPFPKVKYLPLSVLITSFKKENVKKPLEGFGVLVPSKEQEHGLQTLGTLFSSMMFPDRAPDDQYLYTTFVGGSRNRELASAPLDKLKEIVTSDLRKLLGAEGKPAFVKHVYWKNAFPLYGHNYDSVLEAMENLEKGLPGFFYAGNHRGGLSVGKSITSGLKAADLALSYLKSDVKPDA